MNTMKKISLWTLGAVFALASLSADVQAATSDTIDINVSISGTKSVLVSGTTYYDFGALAVNTSSNSASAIVVQNNSTVFIETYTITGANAISDAAGTDWTLNSAGTQGGDQYGLGAQFGTARPDNVDGTWTDDYLDTAPITCNATILGNGTEAEGGSNVATSATRNLWFRMKTPTTVTDGGGHTTTVTVSVL